MTQAFQSPGFAALAGDRAVETRLVDERWQAVAWDLGTGRRRVVTDRPEGVHLSEIEPDGDAIWWFDADGAGEGRWRREPFAGGSGGSGGEALHGVPRGRAYGVAFDRTGALAAVVVGVDGGSHCYLGPPGGEARLIGSAPGYLSLADLSPDGRLLVLGGRPDGDDAVVLLPADARAAGPLRLAGHRRRRLWPIEFNPLAALEPELLVVVEEDERYTVATWRAGAGLTGYPGLSFDSQISAGWYQGPRGVLIQHERAGRSRLLLADLDPAAGRAPKRQGTAGPGTVGRRPAGHDPSEQSPPAQEISTPGGTIHDLSCAPDGTLHCVWSRESTPPRLLVLRPGTSVAPDLEADRGDISRSRRWTPRPYGPIHSFVSTPAGQGPWPTLFLVHGGPATHDRDSYDPRVNALVDQGYAVVRTNYRGSTGYGARWQHEYGHRVGLAQIEDLAAVRAELVADGTALAERTGLCGFSWGGYLTLLALGAQPDLWSLGMAAQPIADYPAVYRTTTPALRELDRQLFGGTPDEVPERYRAADPRAYVRQVRSPVLLVASRTDERCPPEQVAGYADDLRRLAVPHELLWVDGGHYSRRTADHRSVLAAMVRFAGHAWPAPLPRTPRGDRPEAPADPLEGGEQP
ncbi:peptide hydrolase [Kitasatospora xanthocidica]|uniref:alpha/beta hydrolase family protein n=1 Tax=Kitasatospora xanthocidica TaxID=83382 RepID=UPI0016771992|nr:prolyl oligopeptidase family serine peptidase [Kitasatospora xanthocidica]GHF75303.1 peptide hydrolase [Kitasatospora xanthocidica]